MKSMSVLSTALVKAWRSGQPLNAEAATHLAPPDEPAAYRVQREVGGALGWYTTGRPRAWKMGAASRDAVPTGAPIPDPALLDSPAHLAATSAHTLIGVEVELAVRLAPTRARTKRAPRSPKSSPQSKSATCVRTTGRPSRRSSASPISR